jgi:hypothetical protein
MSETPPVVIVMAAMAVSILRLPLSAVVLTLLLTVGAGVATAPLVITSTVVAYIATLSLSAMVQRHREAVPETR